METLEQCILCGSSAVGVLCAQNRFARCGQCRHVFDNPRPGWSEIVRFYSQHDKYDDWLKEERGRDDLWKRRLTKLRNHASRGRLLDVGAGIGQFLKYARAHFEVAGTEISPVAVSIAREKYGLDLSLGTLEDRPASDRFDVITLFHVLEHVPSPGATLDSVRERLAPGGILVLAVPNDIDSLLSARNRWLRRMGREKYGALGAAGIAPLTLDGGEIHLSHFTAPVLRSALERKGFEVVEDSLDPYFCAEGFRKTRRYARYLSYRGVKGLTGKNLYDTIWMVGRR